MKTIRNSRILIECGDSLLSGINTGIQRVGRNLSQHVPAVANDNDMAAHVLIHGFYGWCDAGPYERWLAHYQSVHGNLPKGWLTVNAPYMSLERLKQRLRARLYKTRFQLRISRYGMANILEPQPGEGDLLVIVDPFWRDGLVSLARKEKKKGVAIGIVCYDLIPVYLPECTAPSVASRFNKSLQELLGIADFFITISKTVSNDLRRYAADVIGETAAASIRIASFSLGSTIHDMNIHSDLVIRSEFQDFMENPAESNKPYLMVGTIEPRKNHTLVLNAFEQLWTQHPDLRLCIIGREGWLCAELIKNLILHPKAGKNLLWIKDATDFELNYSYRHAKALIMASKAEGFGLPLAEALQHGLTVLASDIPIHREVGQGACQYFPIQNPDGLIAVIRDLENRVPRPAEPFTALPLLPDWQESACEFLAICKRYQSELNRP